MTDKEAARFKVKFPKINLSKARLDGIKLNLADDAEDADIDAKLDEINGHFSYEDMAKADDRNRQQPKPPPAPTPAPGNPPADPAPTDADMPAWAKALLDQNKVLVDKVNAIENGKTVDTRKQQLEAKLATAPDAYKSTIMKTFALMGDLKDDAFNTWLGDIETDLPAIIQTQANDGLGQMRQPVKATGPAPKTASKEEVQAIFGKPKA